MGLDGGTVISRSDVLRGASWEVNQRDCTRSTRGGSVATGPSGQNTTEQQAERVASWTTCTISGSPCVPCIHRQCDRGLCPSPLMHALITHPYLLPMFTGQALTEPVVADRLGRLFTRNGIVEYLLAIKHDVFVDGERSVHKLANSLRTAPGAFDNIRSLKDVFPVHILSDGPQGGAASERDSAAAASSGAAAPIADGTFAAPPYVCPVTALPCTRYPFSALRPCGHVLSNRALACISQDALSCPICGKAYREDQVVPINGTKEQVGLVRMYRSLDTG